MPYDEMFFQVSLFIVYVSLLYNVYQILAQYFCLVEDASKDRANRKRPNYLQPKLKGNNLQKMKEVYSFKRDEYVTSFVSKQSND